MLVGVAMGRAQPPLGPPRAAERRPHGPAAGGAHGDRPHGAAASGGAPAQLPERGDDPCALCIHAYFLLPF